MGTPSEATFRGEADGTRGCVAGRKWRPEEARVSVVTCLSWKGILQ